MGSEGSAEQKREPMNKMVAKPTSIKGAKRKSGGCALKAAALTSGDLPYVAKSRLREM